jgi:DNA-binding MarR family transcriptional regulator
MEKKGYIVRVPCDEDGRRKKILLTEKSERRHLIFKEEIDRLESKINSGLSAEEISEFFRIIDKIKANIGDELK